MVVVSNGIRFELGDVRSKRRIRENVKLLNDGMGGGMASAKMREKEMGWRRKKIRAK